MATLNYLTQDDVIRVGVLLARARREIHFAVAHRVVDQFLVSEGAKLLRQLEIKEIFHPDVIDVVGGVAHQHPHRYLIRRQQIRQPASDLVIQVDAPLLDQHQ